MNDGLCGLQNLGNTCFMNSCLQILSHTDSLQNEVKKITKIKNNENKKLFLEWIKLNNSLWNSSGHINPVRFHKEFQNTAKRKKNLDFIGYSQNDVAEFIVFILDIFHESCKLDVEINIKGDIKNKLDETAVNCYKQFINNHKNDYSLFTKLFYHMSVTNNISLKTGKLISQIFESNFILDIPIPQKKTCNLYDCLDFFFREEKLLNENGIIDEETNEKHDIVQDRKIWDPPQILIIALKRFSYTGSKNNKFVSFPIEKLNLNKYVCGYNNNNIYDLYGICNHSGVTNGGHYTSFVKTKDSWVLFNDTMVTKIKNNIENVIISQKAYCLFYKKKN